MLAGRGSVKALMRTRPHEGTGKPVLDFLSSPESRDAPRHDLHRLPTTIRTALAGAITEQSTRGLADATLAALQATKSRTSFVPFAIHKNSDLQSLGLLGSCILAVDDDWIVGVKGPGLLFVGSDIGPLIHDRPIQLDLGLSPGDGPGVGESDLPLPLAILCRTSCAAALAIFASGKVVTKLTVLSLGESWPTPVTPIDCRSRP